MKKVNILVAGVGGQGLITLSNVLAKAAVASGTKVLVAETHGLSQRGGSVEVHVRMGDIYAPLIPIGGADILVGMELIEAARFLYYLKKGGTAVLNDRVIKPAVPGVKEPARNNLIKYISSHTGKAYLIDALATAQKAGSSLAQNMVLLGSLLSTGLLEDFVSKESVIRVIRTLRNAEINEKAFELGFSKTNILRRI
ncbi:MAG: indolepyruvate oxidoreductase subunit beta [Desulfurococcales archaeon]|nr:indolepyruvate oxidoreductase subunit beta [Desulfurococcales archaeon]